MKYCRKCILPDTRPNIVFDEHNICDGCKSSIEKTNIIDWSLRQENFIELVKSIKNKNCQYDCIIPVSGGKDSTYQVITMLENNMNPLCVTSTTDKLSDIGRRNIENIKD